VTVFIVIAATLALVALAVVLPPLLRRGSRPALARAQSNLALLQDQLAELESDLKSGTITAERYHQARAELEGRVLEEVRPEATATPAPAAGRSPWLAVAIALLIPVAAGLMYLQTGNPDALSLQSAAGDPHGDGGHQVTQQEIDAMLRKLDARLKENPGDLNGWITLARTNYALKRYPEAVAAFEKASAKAPQDADLLADYADALAMAQGRQLTGKPLELIQRALKIDPKQWKALAMAGTEAFDRRDYAAAVRYWETLQASLPADAEIAKSIAGSIAEARELGGMKGAPAAKGAPVAKAEPAPAAKGAAGTAVSGRVSLSPALAAKVKPTDTVYIFARAAQGSKMPAALITRPVKDLPLEFTLDDSQAMSPEFRISGLTEVVVGARISRAGSAMPQSGDLQGLSAPVKPGARGVTVVIDGTLP
jgi:cytochrome c-type biogenesis protein CcmH